MTQEQRDEKNKKFREKYHQTKENMDAIKLKRKREKARLAAMTQEERNEKNRKRRERYHQKKTGKSDFAFLNSVLPFLVYLIYSECHMVPVGVDSTTESTDVYEDSDWLHRNNSYNPMRIDKDNTCTILVFFLNTNYFFVVFV